MPDYVDYPVSPSLTSGLFAECEVQFDQLFADNATTAGVLGFFEAFGEPQGVYLDFPNTAWKDEWGKFGAGIPGNLDVDTWHTVALSYDSAPAFTVDGDPGTPGGGSVPTDAIVKVRVGVVYTGSSFVGALRIRNVKVGTTLGGTDIASDATEYIYSDGPLITAAEVTAFDLRLTFDQFVPDASTPATSAFTVTADGTPVTVTAVEIVDQFIHLTLATAIPAGTPDVLVSYAVPVVDDWAIPAFTDYPVTVLTPALTDGGRVMIAFDDPALEPDPTWTTIDTTNNLVAGIDIRRGRQTELDQTDTSTATVYLHDTAGLFDPNNTGSPYFGLVDGKQIMLQCWNPVALEWVPQWRGFIDDQTFDFNPAVNADGEPLVANVALECVDLFEFLARVEMIPGLFGDAPPVGSEGVVFYEDTDWQTRIVQLLTDAGVPSALRRVFTGNVDVIETKYDPGDSILAAVRDACDAEFPGIANVYVDKLGRIAAHGRYARFDPETTMVGSDWDFTRWKAGDGAAVALDSDRAQIRPPLTWSRPRSRIINAGLAYPRGMAETDMPGQVVSDAPSVAAFGVRSWSAVDLITAAGTTTGNTAKDECRLFATYYVENYKDPRTRVESLTLKSIRTTNPAAGATWALLCGQDISDVVNLKHGYPDGVGVDEDFYIEGSDMTIRPLNTEYDLVELTLNVSPAAYYPIGWWS